MRNLIFFMHTSLDGFVGGPNGEMNWITINDEIFDLVDSMTPNADTALYGRVTYEMMQAYWPTAADNPNASRHTINHAAWYKDIEKVVLSTTMSGEGLSNTTVISNDLSRNINELKNREGKNILIFGSPRASHSLLKEGLVDEFWLFVNPVLLGQGIPLFKDVPEITKLNLVETKTFACEVVAMHYARKQD